MRLGILEAGRPPTELDPIYGRYPAMFADLLRPHLAEETDFIDHPVLEDIFPHSVTDCDAWLITGSAFGVYDDIPFIVRLMDFIRAAVEAGIPMVGICFGHQAITQALGGEVVKSDKGWGTGAHCYTMSHSPDWMVNPAGSFETYVSHQDQVITPPPGATVLAGSDFCPNAMMMTGERIFTLQSHTEMSSAYVRALYSARRARIGNDTIEAALSTITETETAPDAERVASWISDFLTHTLKN